MLDFGAAGKGYLVDIVAGITAEHGAAAYCVDAGGDIAVHGRAVRVGLEHPDDPLLAIGIAEIDGMSICGSAGNRRRWQGFHHIIDPHRLASTTEVLAAWVVAESTLLADMLATCLFFVPAERLAERYRFEHVTVFADRSAERSSGFPGELFEA